MISIDSFSQVYFYRPSIDFRRGINGLAGLVQDELHLNPFGDKYLFIFINSKSNKLKALYWDKNGFALWQKSLIEDKFKWPVKLSDDVICVDVKKLEEFLNGLDPFQIPFKEKNFSKV